MLSFDEFFDEMITSACFSTPGSAGGFTPSNYFGTNPRGKMKKKKGSFFKTQQQKTEDEILAKQRKFIV